MRYLVGFTQRIILGHYISIRLPPKIGNLQNPATFQAKIWSGRETTKQEPFAIWLRPAVKSLGRGEVSPSGQEGSSQTNHQRFPSSCILLLILNAGSGRKGLTNKKVRKLSVCSPQMVIFNHKALISGFPRYLCSFLSKGNWPTSP